LGHFNILIAKAAAERETPNAALRAGKGTFKLMKKVALLGFGGWGKNHARTLCEMGALKRISDPNVLALEQAKTLYPSVDFDSDVNETLADPSVDAVVVATPPSTHFTLAKRALEAGKDVLVEKPMALKTEEGEVLNLLARSMDRVLMVGHVLEYHPAILKLRELIEGGELGKVFCLQSSRLNLGKVRTEENALWSFAPHDLALLLRLFHELPESVACHGGAFLNSQVADMTTTFIRFPSGRQAQIVVSWLHPFKEHKLVVVGSKQMAVFDDLQSWDEKLTLYPHRVDWIEGMVPQAIKAERHFIPLKPEEPLKAELTHFLECIKSRNAPLTDGDSGVQVLKLLAAAQKSMELKGVPQPYDVEKNISRVTIHPSAVVDSAATLGAGTKVWHYSHIMAGAKLGERCVLGQNVHISKNVTIGQGVKIQNNVSVYEGVVLEDYVFCGPSMVFTNVFNPRSEIERKNEFRKTIVRQGATLGANCTIVCGVEIGRYALVGAGAVVTQSVPDFGVVYGTPARLKGWICRCGAGKLVFKASAAQCRQCGADYYKRGKQFVEELKNGKLKRGSTSRSKTAVQGSSTSDEASAGQPPIVRGVHPRTGSELI